MVLFRILEDFGYFLPYKIVSMHEREYFSREEAFHLLDSLCKSYVVSIVDWDFHFFSGLDIDWNYKGCYIDCFQSHTPPNPQ